MMNELVPVFPASSVTVHVTDVIPTGSMVPDFGSQTGVPEILTLSETVGNG